MKLKLPKRRVWRAMIYLACALLIGRLARRQGVPFHVDGVGVVGRLPLAVDDAVIDLLTISSNDFFLSMPSRFSTSSNPRKPTPNGNATHHHDSSEKTLISRTFNTIIATPIQTNHIVSTRYLGNCV